MRQVKVVELDFGVLWFKYEWDSTTGYLADLDNCYVGEKVDYPGGNPYYWPSPPWSYSSDNPTVTSDSATVGVGYDTHLPGTFIEPYQLASFTATQVYQYHCSPCMGDVLDRNNWATLLDIGPIYRFVTGEGTLWRYSIIKSGVYNEWFPLP